MSEERRTIGPYEIIRLLGKGGMSEVYEVENPRLGSRHALMHTALSDRDRQIYRAYAMGGEDIGEVAKMFRSVPKDRQDECIHRALNLIPDENVMLLAGV